MRASIQPGRRRARLARSSHPTPDQSTAQPHLVPRRSGSERITLRRHAHDQGTVADLSGSQRIRRRTPLKVLHDFLGYNQISAKAEPRCPCTIGTAQQLDPRTGSGKKPVSPASQNPNLAKSENWETDYKVLRSQRENPHSPSIGRDKGGWGMRHGTAARLIQGLARADSL